MIDKPIPVLRRALNLPRLVFYGVGVAVGTGVFALIGEVVRVSGDYAVLAFLVAGLVASFTPCPMLGSKVLTGAPQAAIYVKMSFGEMSGRMWALVWSPSP